MQNLVLIWSFRTDKNTFKEEQDDSFRWRTAPLNLTSLLTSLEIPFAYAVFPNIKTTMKAHKNTRFWNFTVVKINARGFECEN